MARHANTQIPKPYAIKPWYICKSGHRAESVVWVTMHTHIRTLLILAQTKKSFWTATVQLIKIYHKQLHDVIREQFRVDSINVRGALTVCTKRLYAVPIEQAQKLFSEIDILMPCWYTDTYTGRFGTFLYHPGLELMSSNPGLELMTNINLYKLCVSLVKLGPLATCGIYE